MAETSGMNWQSIGESALTGGAGAVAGGILGLIGARVQRKQQEKLMAKQFQYQKKAFEMENARQDWLMQNSQSIAKSALQQAGYSTADPNGTGVTPGATGTLDSPTQSAPSADIGSAALQGAQVASNLRLAHAQEANLNADTKKKGSENDIIQMELQNYRDTYQERVDTIKSQFYNLTKQNKKLDADIDNLAAATANIEVDTRFKEATFDANKEKLFNELALLVKDNKIKEIESKLADYGIILGASDIGSILSIAASNKGSEAAEMFGRFIGSVVGAIPRALGEMLRALWEEATR